jgi:hypothetical protein
MPETTEIAKVDKNASNGLQAGIAGAGGGTLLILIADTIPESWGVKPFLIYLAPTISIVLSVFWLWIKKRYADYNRNKKLDLALKELEKFMNDPATSQDHKEQLRRSREQIQLAVVTKRMKDVEKLYEKDDVNWL